jgi:hypothetical protein
MEDIKLNEIRFNTISEEITTNFFNQITPYEYISHSTIDSTLKVNHKKLKIKDLGIKGTKIIVMDLNRMEDMIEYSLDTINYSYLRVNELIKDIKETSNIKEIRSDIKDIHCSLNEIVINSKYLNVTFENIKNNNEMKCILEESKLIIDHRFFYEISHLIYYLNLCLKENDLDILYLDEIEQSINLLKNNLIVINKLLKGILI